MRVWLNFAGYQAVWFASVLGAAHGAAWVGVVCCLTFVAVQTWASPWWRADLQLAGVAVLLGLLLDGALAQTGVVVHTASTNGLPAPLWILSLWAAFALTLNHSLAFLRPGTALWMGALGGPLAYLAGARMGAIQLPSIGASAAVQALCWALAVWLLVTLARRWRHASTQHRGRAEAA